MSDTFTQVSTGFAGTIALDSTGVAYVSTPSHPAWLALSNVGVTAPLLGVSAGLTWAAVDSAGLAYLWTAGAWVALPVAP